MPSSDEAQGRAIKHSELQPTEDQPAAWLYLHFEKEKL